MKTWTSKKKKAQKKAKRSVGRRNLDHSPSQEVKTNIVKVAKRHFAVHGFQGASLKEISKESDVAPSLLNYHFKDKTGLFNFCLDEFSQPWGERMDRILVEPQNLDEFRVRLELFVGEVAHLVINESEIFAIVKREMGTQLPHVVRVFENTIAPSFNKTVRFFKQAQANHLVRPEFNPQLLAKLIFDIAAESFNMDETCNALMGKTVSDKKFLSEMIDHIIEIFCKGILPHDKKSSL